MAGAGDPEVVAAERRPAPPSGRAAVPVRTRSRRHAVHGALAAVVVAIAAVSAAGCSNRQTGTARETQGAAGPESYKIGLMTGAASSREDEFRAGQQLAKKYGRRLVHVTYPDDFLQERETVTAQLSGLAADPAVRVIVVGQAIPGSVEAARRIRQQRPDILIGFVEPYEDPVLVDEACDISVQPGESGPEPLAVPERLVAICAVANLLVDAVDGKADCRDSAAVKRYLESEAGARVRISKVDARPGGNQYRVWLDHPTD